jgi:hypothetical protein
MTEVTHRGQSDVMQWCGGVTRAAVSNWFARFPDEVPQPDVVIANEGTSQVTRGWLPGRRAEWELFAASRDESSGGANTTKRVRRTADMIYQGVQEGRIDPAEGVKLLHELI